MNEVEIARQLQDEAEQQRLNKIKEEEPPRPIGTYILTVGNHQNRVTADDYGWQDICSPITQQISTHEVRKIEIQIVAGKKHH